MTLKQHYTLKRPNQTIGITTKLRSKHNLTLQTRRLYVAMLVCSQQQGHRNLYEAPLETFVEIAGLSDCASRLNDLKDLLSKLASTLVEYNERKSDGAKIWGVESLISSPRIEQSADGSNVVRWSLPEKIANEVIDPGSNYTLFSSTLWQQLTQTTTVAAFALAEICIRYSTFARTSSKPSTPFMPVADWAAMLSSKPIDGDVTWRYLYRDTIKPAIDEVQEKFNLTLEIRARSKGIDCINWRNPDEICFVITHQKNEPEVQESEAFLLDGPDVEFAHHDYDESIMSRLIALAITPVAAAKIYQKHCSDLSFLKSTLAYVETQKGGEKYLRAALKNRYIDNLATPAVAPIQQVQSDVQTDPVDRQPPSPGTPALPDLPDPALRSAAIDRCLEDFAGLARDEQESILDSFVQSHSSIAAVLQKRGLSSTMVQRTLGNFLLDTIERTA